MKGSESESEVAQLCLTLCDPMECSPPGSSIHGILQATVLEWVAISSSTICILGVVYFDHHLTAYNSSLDFPFIALTIGKE